MSRDFFCFSLLRSGHHAVMNWLRSHISTVVWGQRKSHKVISFPDMGYVQGAKILQTGNLCEKTSRRLGRERQAFCNVVINCENQHLVLNSDKVQMPNREIINVLILRDPFNNIASIAQHHHNLIHSSNYGERLTGGLGSSTSKFGMKLWRNYAKEFVGETEKLPNKMLVNFNLWLSSEEYRDSLSQQIGGKPDPEILNYVATQGQGSSFDKLKFQDRAREMKLSERWKTLTQDNKELFDEEIFNLARKIFGEDFSNSIIDSF